jgi:acyl-CoA thioester hydrolase
VSTGAPHDPRGPFALRLRVYYEDTDAGGIVYYANYLKFAERARTEALLALGLSQTDLRERYGVVFAVREAEVRYLAPARLEDQLVVTAEVTRLGGASATLAQEIRRGSELLARCRIELACIREDGRPARLPTEVRAGMARFGAGGPAL